MGELRPKTPNSCLPDLPEALGGSYTEKEKGPGFRVLACLSPKSLSAAGNEDTPLVMWISEGTESGVWWILESLVAVANGSEALA